MKSWVTWIGLVLLVCSCSDKKGPNRGPSLPFSTIRFEGSTLDHTAVFPFDYQGEAVWLEGHFENDPIANEVILKGTYRTTQDLQAGAQLAIQIYDETENLLVRDLPRIPFEWYGDGSRTASLNQAYHTQDWGVKFNIENIILQFNYIQEGEFWYDKQYPEIELPSIKIEKVNAIERFSIRWALIPRILPRDTYAYLPAIFLVRKNHEEDYFHDRSFEAFSLPGKLRQEQVRYAMESAWRLGEGRLLAVNSYKSQNTGSYLVRHGFVWDGVQWFEGTREDNLKKVWVVPASWYLLVLVLVFGLLFYGWHQMGQFHSSAVRRLIRSLIILALVILTASVGTNTYGLILLVFVLGLWVATQQWSKEIRLYLTALLMLSVLECCWSYLYGNSSVRFSGFLLSIMTYAIFVSPIALVKNSTFTIIAILMITVLAFSNYLLLDLYFDFFNDYPSLRVIGYSSQVSNLTDSILHLFNDSHAVSLVIVVWFTICMGICFKNTSRTI